MRTKLFISHATPHDNDFSIWLASRLTMAGYSVWLDKQALLGGEDFWDDIERTIRNEAAKVLVAVTPHSVHRPGVKREIALADATARKHDLANFMVPVRAGPIDWGDFPGEFIRTNGVDFHGNWGAGLVQLLELLDRDEVPKSPSVDAQALQQWKDCQTTKAKATTDSEEVLVSNRIGVETFPQHLRVYELKRPLTEAGEVAKLAKNCPLPCFAHNRLLFAYAALDELQAEMGPENPLRLRSEIETEDFLTGETTSPAVRETEAWKLMASLVRKAINKELARRGLKSREMANGELSWWFPDGLLDKNKISFTDTDGTKTYRAVCGKQKSRRWYLGFTLKPSIGRDDYITLRPRVMVGDESGKLLPDGRQMNNARKRVCKSWFNNRWRGQVVGFVEWLRGDNECPRLPVSETDSILLNKGPLEFTSPLAIVFNDAITTDEEELQERLNDPGYKPLDDGEEED